MPTYRQIQDKVKFTSGFVPKTCWIADVLTLVGKKLRAAPNRIDPHVRKNPCPIEKQWAIISAIRQLETLLATGSSL